MLEQWFNSKLYKVNCYSYLKDLILQNILKWVILTSANSHRCQWDYSHEWILLLSKGLSYQAQTVFGFFFFFLTLDFQGSVQNPPLLSHPRARAPYQTRMSTLHFNSPAAQATLAWVSWHGPAKSVSLQCRHTLRDSLVYTGDVARTPPSRKNSRRHWVNSQTCRRDSLMATILKEVQHVPSSVVD